ncbi:T9SS type A sorting domain-containing protein [Flavobacterium sp.]|uniref:T9SS type A sorting domain-containing protein n=1 Tax=Flavobacterium sp. TaxID=239 RepID=UPI00286D4C46|nr:T9SS type A sorting domain-containing protein [Flavobacterium sp.]
MKTKLFLSIIMTLTTVLMTAQIQIGSDIDGEASGDELGATVSLSSDGTIMAVGAPFNDGNGSNSGRTRVYQNLSGVWTQIGADLNGDMPEDVFGSSVSLSADGNTLAVGIAKSDAGGLDSGAVKVFQNQSGVWTQLGSTINGEAAGDKFGRFLATSSNGHILAVGTPFHDSNGTNSGVVTVFEYSLGVWTPLGNKIYGSVNDYLGYSISLSSDGNIMAIGAPLNGAGRASVYQNISGVWTPIGLNIVGETAGDFFGGCVSLSSDGSKLAIGAYSDDTNGTVAGSVKVFQNQSGIWEQVGAKITGDVAGEWLGSFICLSSSGNVLVVGAPKSDANATDAGIVKIYQNQSGVWTLLGNRIYGEAAGDFSGVIALSSNENVLANGAYANDGGGANSGHVRVYDLSSILANDSFVSDAFTIYPNPTKSDINITLDENQSLQKVNIYNPLGQLIATDNKNNISLATLPKGSYYVEVITNHGKATKSIIVE